MVAYLSAYTIPNANYVDFTRAYYEAGSYVLTDWGAFYRGKLPEFVNIPLVAYLFVPFSWLEERSAVLLFLVLSILAIGFSIRVLLRAVATDTIARRAIVWLFACNGPLFYSIKLGNLTHFLLPCLLYTLLRYRGSPVLAGVVCGFCAIIKLPLLLVGVYYVARRRWRLALGFWVTIAVVGLASLAIFGWDLHQRWYVETIGRYSGKIIGAYNVQSITGFLAHLAPRNQLFSWVEADYGLPLKAAKIILATLFTAIVAYGIWVSARRGETGGFQRELCAVICLALFLSPVSWIHYYLLLLPFTVIFLGQSGWAAASAVPRSFLLPVAVFLLTLPVFQTLPGKLALGVPVLEYLFRNVLVSHYFFGGVVLLGYALFRGRDDAALNP